MKENITYVFGSFRLETATQLLHSEGGLVQLPYKVNQLLLYFLQNPGRLLSHQEIFNELWQGRVVENVALRFAVNHLRKLLQDDCKQPAYILTVCKFGYRFLPAVTIEVGNTEGSLIVPINRCDLDNLDKVMKKQAVMLLQLWFEQTGGREFQDVVVWLQNKAVDWQAQETMLITKSDMI